MIIVEEIPWLHFVKLPNIAKLPLEEQVAKYRQHQCEIELIRVDLACQGKSSTKVIANVGFLQQENNYYILQEDGSKIYVTAEVVI